MKNKDFFKKVLENEMPDLEVVRKKCINETPDRKSIFITLIKSDLLLKRILPLVACVAITVISVSAFYEAKDTPEQHLISPQQFSGDNFNGNIPPKKSTKKSTTKYNGYQNDYQSNTTNNQTVQTQTTRTESLGNNQYLDKPNASKNFVTFNNLYELKAFASSLKVEENEVIVNAQTSFILKIPANELEMFLNDRKVYDFSINGQSVMQNGVVERFIADDFTGCSFSANYNGIEYEMGYSTYKCSKSISADEEFTTSKGYNVKIVNGNYFTMNIDGYHFYIKSLSNDYLTAKEFVNNLSVSFYSID